jgi:hypothetical protein
MNNKQRIIITITLLGIGVMFLFPPWARLEYSDAGQGQVLLTVLERRLFNNPPETSVVRAPYVAWRYPLQDSIAVTVVASALCFILRTRKTRNAVAWNDNPSPTAAF